MKYTTREELVKDLVCTQAFQEVGKNVTDVLLSNTSGMALVVARYDHISTLDELELNAVKNKRCGLCANFFNDVNIRSTVLHGVFELWAGYSGRMGYPIRTGDWTDPGDEYEYNQAHETMYSGEYGQARFELFRHVIDCFKLLCE